MKHDEMTKQWKLLSLIIYNYLTVAFVIAIAWMVVAEMRASRMEVRKDAILTVGGRRSSSMAHTLEEQLKIILLSWVFISKSPANITWLNTGSWYNSGPAYSVHYCSGSRQVIFRPELWYIPYTTCPTPDSTGVCICYRVLPNTGQYSK